MNQKKIVPLYHQIYLTLRNELLTGHYASNDDGRSRALPGEIELAELFHASRVTVRRALKELEEEGLVVKRHGAGTFPAVAAKLKPRFRSNLDRLYDDLSGLVDGYESKVLKLGFVNTPSFVSEILPDFGDSCLHLSMVSWCEGQPVHLNNQYIPRRLAELIDIERVGVVPLLLLLQKQGVTSQITDLVMSATSADIYSASHLDIAAGTPLIAAMRTSVDHEGRGVEYFEALTRPDLYGYKFRFTPNAT
jgi:GntR family transcriptional regulator